MRTNIIILFCIIFFLYGNVGMTFLHIPAMSMNYALFGYGLCIMGLYKQEWSKVERLSLWIVGSALFWLCFRYIVGAQGAFRETIFILILPAFLISALPHGPGVESLRFRILVSRFLCCFFIVECSVAIFEFVTRQHIFGWVEQTYAKGLVKYGTSTGFRSVALLSSPLNNALVVTIMMLFYLFDPGLPLKRKMPLWLLGLVAVFCFNARTAIAINMLGGIVFMCRYIFKKGSINKFQLIVLSVAACIIIYILYSYGWGGRFWETGRLAKDGSIGVRLRLFEYLSKANWSDYLWGYSEAKVRHDMATKIGVKVIENFWVLYIFRLGIFATVWFALFYFRLCKELLAPYPLFNKVTVSLLFLALASSNNSIYAEFMPLFVFTLCAYAHRPVTARDLILFIDRQKDDNT